MSEGYNVVKVKVLCGCGFGYIESQTTALWLVFPEDLEEAAEMLAER